MILFATAVIVVVALGLRARVGTHARERTVEAAPNIGRSVRRIDASGSLQLD